MAQELIGNCLCGAVKITVAGAHDPRVGACHCRMCQRWSGGLFLCFEAEPQAVTITGDVTRYASSEFAERVFCPRCGSNLWMRNTGSDAATFDLMPGLFDAALDWPLRSEIYTDRAMACVSLEGEHRRETETEYEANNSHVNEGN